MCFHSMLLTKCWSILVNFTDIISGDLSNFDTLSPKLDANNVTAVNQGHVLLKY
jgi:hypothetical protein